MNNYPFAKCEHPKKIRNPYTGEYLVVPCGHCKVCLLNKNNRYAFQCELESLAHKYTYFVTLTYDNSSLPCTDVYEDTDFIPKQTDSPLTKKFIFADSKTGEIIDTQIETVPFIQRLQNKVAMNGKIPYVNKYDVQKFLKRLRKRISVYTSEKIRYYVCAEYGPVHFRPHYHLILWFDSEKVANFLWYNVRKSWSLGRIDCQPVKSSASDYVASYINSTCLIPEIFKHGAFRPFNLHSTRLGQAILGRERDKIYELDFERFVNRSLVINGKFKDFNVWTSYYAYFFPKCKGFATSTDDQLYRVYTIFERSVRTFYNGVFDESVQTVMDVAKTIYSYFKGLAYGFISPKLREYDNYTVEFFRELIAPDFFSCLKQTYAVNSYVAEESEKNLIQSIYSVLLKSRHFLEFCCNGSTDYYLRMEIIRKIKDFYSYLDYSRLTQWYESQQLWFDSDLFSDDDLPFFYDNLDADKQLSECLIYQLFIAEKKRMFVDKTKHKLLNDANDIFFSPSTKDWLINN